jgi:rhomboid family GlyGly-CTERM serine protease
MLFHQPATTIRGTKVPRFTVALTALLVGLHCLSPYHFDELAYDRAAIMSGEIWRMITGHLVHLDWQHLALNAAAFIGLGWLIETDGPNGRRTLMSTLVASAVLISCTLLLFAPATAYYAGLSGALNGLFALVCVTMYRSTRIWIWPALLIGGSAKIIWETTWGSFLSGSLIWPPDPVAHMTGLAAGIVCAAWLWLRRARHSWYFPWACFA